MWILIATAGLVSIVLLTPLSRINVVKRIVIKLKEKLLWNTILRTVMQTSLEFGFCAVFTIRYAENDGGIAALINFTYAYVFSLLLCILPIFFIIFYKMHFDSFYIVDRINEDDDEFIRRGRRFTRSSLGSHLNDLEKVEALCVDFYLTGEMDRVTEAITSAYDDKMTHAVLEKVSDDETDFLNLLDDLNYIESFVINEQMGTFSI